MLRIIYGINQWVCTLILCSIVVITVVDIVMRKLLNSPIFGSGEMITYLLALSVGSGMVIASARSSHIKVDLLEGVLYRLLGNLQVRLSKVIEAVGTFFLTALIAVFAYDAWRYGDTSSVLKIPTGYVFFAVAGLMTISLVYIFTSRHGDTNND
ncbi:TRAP transporter small permease [Halomonas mongoliensis]|uniref:TRAP transporter small permease n=1 Tax=Halomonas mongoliensis TaxID=321265 RepID=UPI00403AD361